MVRPCTLNTLHTGKRSETDGIQRSIRRTEASMDPLQALAEVLAASTSSDGTPLDDLLQACHGNFSLQPSADLLLGQPQLPFAVHTGDNKPCPADCLVQQAQGVACQYCRRLHPILLSICRSRGTSPAGTGSGSSTDSLPAEIRFDGGLASHCLSLALLLLYQYYSATLVIGTGGSGRAAGQPGFRVPAALECTGPLLRCQDRGGLATAHQLCPESAQQVREVQTVQGRRFDGALHAPITALLRHVLDSFTLVMHQGKQCFWHASTPSENNQLRGQGSARLSA